jgi:transcriptional regulator with XRE-family HTH domain
MGRKKARTDDAADALDEKEQARRAELAKRVRMRRAELGIRSKDAVALKAGVSKGTYGQLEDGKGNITTKNLWEVADALGVHVTKLLGDPPPE